MSRVFSVEVIELGQIPEPGAHAKAAQFLLDSLFEPAVPGVESGLVYGSTTFGPEFTPSVRSDVDILIGYDTTQASTALPNVRDVLRETEQTYKTPIEAIVLPEAALNDPDQYGIDNLMLRHLLHVQREKPEWQRSNPLPDTLTDCPPDRMTATTIAKTYCNTKVQQLAKALTGDGQVPDLYVMQLVFRLPSTIGRKVLPAILTYDADDRVLDKAWATDTVAQELKAAGKESAASKLDRLAALDSEYSELLDLTICGETSTSQYSAWLAGQYTLACLLAHDISHDLGAVISDVQTNHQID